MRAGESAEDVAASTGWDMAKVLRYAEPMLAERGYIAEQARAVEVRRSGGGATLAEAVEQALGTGARQLAWDSHRRPDGRWIVTADAGGRNRAEWTYDPAGRNLHALNDRARALMGAAPVDATPDDTEVDIAAALDLASDVALVRTESGARPHLVAVPSDDLDDVEPADHEEPQVQGMSHPATARAEQQTLTIPRPEDDPRPQEADPAARETSPPPREPRKARGRKGRASVPSWDEILFGAGRSED